MTLSEIFLKTVMVSWQLDLVFIQKMSVSVHSSLMIACCPLTMHINNHNIFFFLYFLLLYVALILKKNKAYI